MVNMVYNHNYSKLQTKAVNLCNIIIVRFERRKYHIHFTKREHFVKNVTLGKEQFKINQIMNLFVIAIEGLCSEYLFFTCFF